MDCCKPDEGGDHAESMDGITVFMEPAYCFRVAVSLEANLRPRRGQYR